MFWWIFLGGLFGGVIHTFMNILESWGSMHNLYFFIIYDWDAVSVEV